MRAFLAAMIIGLGLSGCALFSEDGAPNAGGGTDDYKKSPCACQEVEMRYQRQFVS